MNPLRRKRCEQLLCRNLDILNCAILVSLVFPGFVFCATIKKESVKNEELDRCLSAPAAVGIECHVLKVENGTCVEADQNVISIPDTEANAGGEINCTSSKPLDVFFVGFQLNDYINTTYVRNAENVFNEATYVYSVSIPIVQIHASREIVVRSLVNPDHRLSFFIFRPGPFIFSSNLRPHTSILNGTSHGIPIEFLERQLVVPCVPNDSNVVPRLIEPVSDGSRISYDKKMGFIVKTGYGNNDKEEDYVDPMGKYVCKAEAGNREEFVTFNVQPKKDAIFEPNEDKVYIFGNSELKISCKYGERVKLQGIFQNSTISPRPIVSDTSVLQYESQLVEKYIKVGDKGSIQCKTLSDEKVLKQWDIEVLDIRNNSVLTLKKVSEDEIICQSSSFLGKDMKLQFVHCLGETECKLNDFCFDEQENGSPACSKSAMGQPCRSNAGKQFGNGGSLCLTLPQNDPLFSQGTIRCSAGNYSYQTNFFRGFDKKLYLNWQDAPLSALIDIKVPNVTMYPHNSYPFGCKAISFISDGKIGWVIRGKDGSEILLHKNRVQDLYKVYASDQDYELYTVRESNIRLIYPNDYDVICMVPKWNETGWIRHHKRINVAAKEAPVAEIVSGAAVVIIILIGMVIFVMWRLKKAKDAIRNLTEKEVQEFHQGNPEALKNAADKDAHEVVDSLPYDQKFEIPREKLLIDTENVLGKGAFGTVLKGRVEGIPDVVAVKTVNNNCEVSRFKGFLSELKIMIYIGKHPYIVSLIGASTEKIQEKTLYIIVEFCSNGSLESHLRKYRESFVNLIVDNEIGQEAATYENLVTPSSTSLESMMTTVDLIRWSCQIANGMQYLANKKVVHADLAARNVLIDAKGNAKITDFGLSRQLFDYTQYVKKQQEPLPWRWMAIESLQQLRFSSKSDVWAYGVLLWEIFSIGDIPYPGLSWDINFVQQLTDGLRLIKPPYCTNGIYNLMLDCWQEDPDSRPNFSFLAQYFKSVLETLDVELEANKESKEENNYVNGNALAPGYFRVSDLGNVDAVLNVRSSNIYINS